MYHDTANIFLKVRHESQSTMTLRKLRLESKLSGPTFAMRNGEKIHFKLAILVKEYIQFIVVF